MSVILPLGTAWSAKNGSSTATMTSTIAFPIATTSKLFIFMIEGSSETKFFAYLEVVTNHNGIENS
jgi:hypothetical protein